MNELITRGKVYIAQPPLYPDQEGQRRKVHQGREEFTKEIMRRATENLAVEIHSNGDGKPKSVLEGQELRTFLLNLDEFQQMFHKVERRLRDSRAVDVLTDVNYLVDNKPEFLDEANLKPVYEAFKAKGLNPQMRKDEEHSAWAVVYHDSTGAERSVGLQLAAQPEYRRFRALASDNREVQRAAVRGGKERTSRRTAGLGGTALEYVKNEGKKDASVQRYKGLGEMNAEQLADTTMNPEKRTLLEVRLEDAVQCETIFSTLMGEDVEAAQIH